MLIAYSAGVILYILVWHTRTQGDILISEGLELSDCVDMRDWHRAFAPRLDSEPDGNYSCKEE